MYFQKIYNFIKINTQICIMKNNMWKYQKNLTQQRGADSHFLHIFAYITLIFMYFEL